MTPVISTRGLTRTYGSIVGIEDLDLAVEAGEVFGFLGPNGSGKTTTIRLLLDFMRPTRGRAMLFGESTRDPAVRARIGYLPGELALDGRMSGHATLHYLDTLLPRAHRGRAARRAELTERLGLSGRDLTRRVREYSRGMKQRLALIAAFQHDPDLLILDEPTEGLDPLIRERVFDLMQEARTRGATVFHSSHVLSEVDRTCDRVAILRRGRLAALMRVEEVRARSARRMVVEFDGDVAASELALDGVEVLETDGRRMVLRVTGRPDALLAALARHRVGYLAFPESTMEEAFARLYQGDAGVHT
ncbi:MAG TPA: ABC transporter ATP-binding protein [Longimicrobiales bacterium]|nr:ABC transporter ATP-binding protein [Longimicrobiales bacterium]